MDKEESAVLIVFTSAILALSGITTCLFSDIFSLIDSFVEVAFFSFKLTSSATFEESVIFAFVEIVLSIGELFFKTFDLSSASF